MLREVALKCTPPIRKKVDESDCYWNDNGCGYHCIDAYSDAHRNQTSLYIRNE